MLQNSSQKPSLIIQTQELAEKTQRWLRLGIDIPLVLSIITLLLFGLLMVYSASYIYAKETFGNSGFYFYRQIIFNLIGVGICFAVSRTKIDFLPRGLSGSISVPKKGALSGENKSTAFLYAFFTSLTLAVFSNPIMS